MSYGNPVGVGQMSEGGYVGPSTAPPTPINPMQQARIDLEKSIHLLHESIEVLERRLSPVCVPAGPSPDQAKQQASNGSELRLFLTHHAALVGMAIERVQSVLSRLEL